NRQRFVAAITCYVERGIGFLAALERFEPPEISVISSFVNLRVRLNGTSHPRFADDALALPYTAIEIELRDLEQVAAGEAQSAAGLRNIQRRVYPLHVADAEWGKQLLLRVMVSTHAGDLGQHLA